MLYDNLEIIDEEKIKKESDRVKEWDINHAKQKEKQRIASKNNNYKKRAIRFGVLFENVDYEYIKNRDNFTCQICHKKINMKLGCKNIMGYSFDHIVPMSMTGNHEIKNIQLVHLGCNLKKQTNIKSGVQQLLF